MRRGLQTASTNRFLTEALVGVQASVLHGSIMALLGVLLVRFVDPCWTVAVGQAVVCQVDLWHKQNNKTSFTKPTPDWFVLLHTTQ